ncbi:MAG: hypothetical protein WC948_04245, partial [Thermovirgaceae bacterium]
MGQETRSRENQDQTGKQLYRKWWIVNLGSESISENKWFRYSKTDHFYWKRQPKIDHLTIAPCIIGEKLTTVEDTGGGK